MTVDFGVFGLNFSLQNPIQDPLLCSNKKYSKCMFPTDDCNINIKSFFFNAISEHLCKFFVNELCFFVNIYIAIVFFNLKQFQAALIKHVTVEVCVELLKFKLTLIHIEPLRVAQRERGAGQTSSVNDLSGSAVEQDDAGRRELAYVLHTSGTTGFPKTVRVPHRCILPNILHLRSVRNHLCLCLL